ncbi:MAG: preprotein translocase subunit YajC [Gammaproteobacteria bacterium HGW-Gammaproteobacteria-4]|jgi:preprotein translocase subunit YajC|nr:MAG: preprotein translocase subunit YajC [Gammaproteobacteria bacterium HGW-Gammaproteobacteria-4]
MDFLDLLISPAYAQAAGAAPSPLQPLIMLGVFFAVFWFFLIRPQMKRAKEHRELVAKLGKGDEVIAAGGIAGRIDELGEHFVTIEIADGVKIKVQRSAVATVLPKNTLKSI